MNPSPPATSPPPPGSGFTSTSTSDGLVITLPAEISGSFGVFAFGAFGLWMLGGLGLGISFHFLDLTIALAIAAWLIWFLGLAVIVMIVPLINRIYPRVTKIEVTSEYLDFSIEGPLWTTRKRWPRIEIVDVRSSVATSRHEGSMSTSATDLHLANGGTYCIAAFRSSDELEWLAATLRQAMSVTPSKFEMHGRKP